MANKERKRKQFEDVKEIVNSLNEKNKFRLEQMYNSIISGRGQKAQFKAVPDFIVQQCIGGIQGYLMCMQDSGLLMDAEEFDRLLKYYTGYFNEVEEVEEDTEENKNLS